MKNFSLFTFLVFILGSTALSPVLAQDELIYVPVDPCRIVDTRIAGGTITANTNRNFRVSGSMGELAVQGSTTDCLDPKAGTGQKPLAISAYVVAVPASGSSNGVLTAYPSHRLPPPVGAGSTVNFAAGQVIGNTTNITLCDQPPCPTDGEFAILARNTKQHVVIDVQGYFYPSSTAKQVVAVDANGNELGLIYGGDNLTLSVLTPQGYTASVSGRSANVTTGIGAGIAYTDSDCGNSGGQAYYAGTSYMAGSVIPTTNDVSQPQPLFYVPKPATLVSNITVQSLEGSGGCLQTIQVLSSALEVFPNDPAITGFPNTPIPAPIAIEYR